MPIPRFMLRHTAVVQPYEGAGAHGDLYGAAVTVRCWAEDTRRRVMSTTGSQVVSSLTLYCPLDTVIPTGSLVTVNGRTTAVINTARRDGGGWPTPDHVEVMCA